MFCAFEGDPQIMRIWCRATVIHNDHSQEFNSLAQQLFPSVTNLTAVRSIIKGSIFEVITSCGYGVPYFEYKSQRETLLRYWGRKDADQVHDYQVEKNSKSIDGLATHPSLLDTINDWVHLHGALFSSGVFVGAMAAVALLKLQRV
ncbi:hypothetical protein HDV03_002212 [Kappamyces sp. JEL0829]|nr:hypothetical protein HDV03_002212 [Kappamyces sp. JEL0829]